MTDYTTLERDARGRIEAAADLAALEALRVEYLGKQGSVSTLLKTLGAMSADERLEKGPKIQGLRQSVSDALAERKAAMEAAELARRLSQSARLPVMPTRRVSSSRTSLNGERSRSRPFGLSRPSRSPMRASASLIPSRSTPRLRMMLSSATRSS